MTPHVHPVSIYYEDTDFSGLVYHANYLKYCERGREHLLGRDRLVSMYRDSGVGFVVYKAEMTFKQGARFGDELQVRTRVELASDFRAVFHQDIHRGDEAAPLVQCVIHLVAVGPDDKLVRLPADVIEMTRARFGQDS
ncbi:MAG: YbgC/FadM family acyl-CoA thioesterase [Myxococcales bacterium]|nr:YbgC/FadM family acyl-CoA thioesterase [Myxococcales bacterium]